jgi:ankyrin repeat protein
MPKDGEWQEAWETPPLPPASSLLRRKGHLGSLRPGPPHRTPLHAAAFADNVSGLRMLLQHQAEVNATDHTGRTALMTAAENGQTAAVGVLGPHVDGRYSPWVFTR